MGGGSSEKRTTVKVKFPSPELKIARSDSIDAEVRATASATDGTVAERVLAAAILSTEIGRCAETSICENNCIGDESDEGLQEASDPPDSAQKNSSLGAFSLEAMATLAVDEAA